MSRPPLFLDLDGPLLDVRDRYHGVYVQIAEELRVAPLARDAYWSAKRRRAALEEFFPGARTGSALRELYLSRWLERIEAPEWLALDQPVDGAEECLAELSGCYSLFLVTLRRDPAALASQLEDLDLWPLFKAVYCGWAEGAEGARVKAQWMRPLLMEGPAAMVGDSEIDMEAAQLLNIRAIGVSFGIRDAADLRALGAETVVDHLSELGPALGASPRPVAMAASAPTLSLRV
jgi:phosphoglycolate phosphatase-like HAD superfamily hydrolase